MFRQSESERREADRRDRDEQVRLLERVYQKGAGCFGVRRKSPEIMKEIQKLRREK